MESSTWMLCSFSGVTILAAGAVLWARVQRKLRWLEVTVCVLIYLALLAILFPVYVGQTMRETHADWRRTHGRSK